MHASSDRTDPRQSLVEVGREATLLLTTPEKRNVWLAEARRARLWLFLVLGLGLLVVPWLSETIADAIFEPERARRLFRADRVKRDPSAETLDVLLQLGFWLAGLGLVARVAWRERPGAPATGHAEAAEGTATALATAAQGAPTAAPPAGVSGTAATAVEAPGAEGTPAALVRYRVESELGRGGMGVVYRATDTVLDRTVALKSLPAELLGHGELVARFRREAKVLAALSHPNIVGVYDLVVQDSQLFMAMELVQGRDLSALIEEQGSLSETEAVSVVLQSARALGYAHAQGIVHRDFKPDNVLMTADGTAKVTDFGIAKAQDKPQMTQTGAVMGTPYYMSPEQASGDKVDARTDLYALGATLYELLCGQPPFVGSTAQILIQHLNQPPPPLAERAPHVDERLVELVHALLEKDRERRPKDMAEVVARLEALRTPASA